MLKLMCASLAVAASGLAAFGQVIKPTAAKPVLAAAQAPAKGNLAETLEKLNAASKRFKSAQADFKKEQVVPPVPDPMVTTGSTYVEHGEDGISMGARLSGADNVVISYSKNDVKLVQGTTSCYNEYSGGSNQGKIETFLTLGFGGSGQDLQRAWEITDQGPETMLVDNHKLTVEKLLLLPKENSVRDVVKTITLWLDLDRGVAVKQAIVAPSNGGTQTAVYSNIRLNQPINKKPYAIIGTSCSDEKPATDKKVASKDKKHA